MGLAERFDEIVGGLPEDWRLARVALTLDDPGQADRAAVILGPATPGRTGATFRLHVHGGTERLAPTPELARRVLARLDEQHLTGHLRALRVLSDTHLAATQGPVWYVGGRSV